MYRMVFMLHGSNSQGKTVPLIKLIAVPLTFSCRGGWSKALSLGQLLEHTLSTIGTR